MRPSTIFTTVLVSGLTFAQNDTNTTICSNQWEIDELATGSINSTGSESLVWNHTTGRDGKSSKPWHVSVLVNNTGNPYADNGGTIAWPYLSVPNNVNANVYTYSFGSRNATSMGNGSRDVGCAGVLSEGCTAYLRAAIMKETSGISSSRARCDMISLSPEDQKRRDEACGPLGTIALKSYKNVGNDTCAFSSLSGVDIPDDYVTHHIGMSLTAFDASPGARWDNYADMAYDIHVVQSTPFAIVAAFESDGQIEKDVQFVCVTPNNTQPGSRVVENKTPWEIPEASVGWRAAPGLSVTMAGIVSLLLALWACEGTLQNDRIVLESFTSMGLSSLH